MDDPQTIIQTLINERDELMEHCLRLQSLADNAGHPPGHFYSPVVNVHDPHAIRSVRERLAAPLPAAVNVDAARMAKTMERLASHHGQFPFPRDRDAQYRFFFANPFFGCHDAAAYFSMLLEFRPRRVIEAGCGYSSCLLLDTNERFFDGTIDIAMIDPAIAGMPQLFGEKGTAGARLFDRCLQDVPVEVFQRLERNDILFLDSSHVCKTGSDVNYYLFEILPLLKPGVLIHIHDILYPFEYPESWVLTEKRSWNEAYLVRAFLSYNPAFEMTYWTNFVWHRLAPALRRLMPLCMENEGGSLWLTKLL